MSETNIANDESFQNDNENLLQPKVANSKRRFRDKLEATLNAIDTNDESISASKSPTRDIENNEEKESTSPPRRSRFKKSVEKLIDQSNEDAVNEQAIKKIRKVRTKNIDLSDKGQVNDAYESDQKGESASAKKARRFIKKEKKDLDTGSKPSLVDNTILAVIIHQTDKLRTDVNIYRPVVRVHVVDLAQDGQYALKTFRERNVLCYYEKENRKLDYISPIMTTPFDFKLYQSIIPKWEEKIIFNEEFSHFTKAQPNIVLLFEILDSSKAQPEEIANPQTNLYTSQDTGPRWQRIAWAFLKIVGSDNSLNTERKIRLQLFYSQTKYRLNLLDSTKPEVYSLYMNGPRVKYPATLYVTVKSIQAPKNFLPGIGSLYIMNNQESGESKDSERDQDNLAEKSGNEKTTDDETTDRKTENDLKTKNAIWSRIAGLPCRIPNDLSLKLKTTKRGCFSIQFSATGSYISCACVGDNNMFPIYVYSIPTGSYVMKFLGHFGLVYEMSWSKQDKYIVTASNDATARIINVENRSKDTYKLLPHPSFIYSAKFHPHSHEIVCTGCYDKVIRVWSIKTKKSQKDGQLLQELTGHQGYVNALIFSDNGKFLYTADSMGGIIEWNCYINSENDKNVTRKDWILEKEIIVDELHNQCISYIHLHPNQFRMLVHLRDNQLKLIDLRLKTVVMRYKGSYSFVQNLKSAMSPCGTFLFSCGADTKINCWNVGTGDQVTTATINCNYIKPARDINFHPYDNFIAFCSFETNASVFVFKFNSDKATKEINYAALNLASVTMMQSNIPQGDHVILTAQEQFESARDARILSRIHEDYDHPTRVSSHLTHFSKQPIPSRITLTVTDSTKPEFRYRGPKEAQDVVVALYEYKAQRNDELDLDMGDEILVLVKESEGWWMGQLVKNGREGYFPTSYVQEKRLDSAALRRVGFTTTNKRNAKDLAEEYEKVYASNALKEIRKPADLAEKTNSIISSLSHNRPSTSKIQSQADLIVDTINEMPTRDESELTAKKRDQTKRRPFGHIISGKTTTTTQI